MGQKDKGNKILATHKSLVYYSAGYWKWLLKFLTKTVPFNIFDKMIIVRKKVL